ncbi:MAG TPA: cation diffusion facilitator family transporter, partial [Geothrix sp.]|nr:cation diffusion facilitator family transporter [Geothrix sp.]
MNFSKPHHYFVLSTVAALLTIILKTGAWWVTGSVGLLSDALESLVNLAGATFALWMITIAKRPADKDHPFGHGKAEYFSSGFEGLLILLAAVAIIVSAASRLMHPQPLEALGVGIVFSGISTAINFAVAIVLGRASLRFRSIALEADSKHLMTDVWTSVGVVVGVLLVALTDALWLDPLIAIVVGLHIVKEGVGLIRASVQGLMDEAVEGPVLTEVELVLQSFCQEGVGWRNLRT